MASPTRKRVFIVYTGGTIGMEWTPEGYAPAPGSLGRSMARMHELQDASMPAYEIVEFDPLLDSANMTPAHWLVIARHIEERYDQFDGFVVLHGTDTMAYTASALAFMLQYLDKPVVVTGSQIPLCRARSDARDNLLTSLLIAAQHDVPEVCLCFGGKLLRGCRATKVSAEGFQAFDSPNFPPLGTIGVDIAIDQARVLRRPSPRRPLEVRALEDATVGALRLFPGISATIVRNFLQPPLRGVVLEAYGSGNGPSKNEALLGALREAADRGVVIVDCTQCLSGRVDLSAYAAGSAFGRAGVIGGADMTAEAALAKLCFLFGCGRSPEEAKREMALDLRGELTAAPETQPTAPAFHSGEFTMIPPPNR